MTNLVAITDEAVHAANMLRSALPGGCRWDNETITSYFTENPLTAADMEGMRRTTELFTPISKYREEPLIWDENVLPQIIAEEMVRIGEETRANIAENEVNGQRVLRNPAEMIAELVSVSGNVDVLTESGQWIWSPYGPPIQSDREQDFYEPVAESNILMLLKQVGDNGAEQTDTAAYHAAKYGHIINHEDIETAISEMYREAQTEYAASVEQVKCLLEDTAVWDKRLKSFRTTEAVIGLAKQRRNLAAENLLMATALGIMRAAHEGNSVEEIGWAAFSVEARCAALLRWWQSNDPIVYPQPDQKFLYSMDYWWRREMAAELETARSLGDEEGFLAAVMEQNRDLYANIEI